MGADANVKVVPDPRFAAERIAGLVTPYVSLTGAEVAVLLESLDKVDRAAVRIINVLIGSEEATLKRIREIARKMVREERMTSRNPEKVADEAVDRLVKFGILRRVSGSRLMHIPRPKTPSTINIDKDESFFLFAGKEIKDLIRIRDEKVLVKGTVLGYACVKAFYDRVLYLATLIARELSGEDPFAMFKSWHFLLVMPNFSEVCWDCIDDVGGMSGRRWVNTGELAVHVNRFYNTQTGRSAIRYLRSKRCPYEDGRSKPPDKKAVSFFKSKSAGMSFRKLDISRLPIHADDSVKYVNFPDPCRVKRRVCGLSLSVAVEWYLHEKTGAENSDPYAKKVGIGLALDDDARAVDAIIRALMSLKSALTPDTPSALKLLAKIMKDRNALLKRPD